MDRRHDDFQAGRSHAPAADAGGRRFTVATWRQLAEIEPAAGVR